MAEVDGNLAGGAWSCYAKYSQSTNDTSSTITITGGMRSHGYGMNLSEVTCVVNQGGYTRSGSSSFYSPYNTWTDKDLCSYSDTWTRTHEDRTINCWAQIDRSSSSYRGGTSTAWLTFTVPAKPHWGVSYDANGGSGAPGDQTKWYGETLTLSSTRPTRTGYTFQGWATSSSGGVSYQPGASYTSNSGLTLYAVWKANTWTVSYDANGGSGAPAAQTKTYGQTLTLSSAIPTRTLYNFKGWATSASSTAVAYQPGASYTTNDNVTLYAVWELAYVRPRITGVSVGRCDKDGKASDEGTYCAVTFSWATDHDVQAVGVSTGVGSYDYKSSGRSGAVSAVIGDGELSIERSYDVEITVSDDLGQSSVTRQISPFSFVMDFAPNGSVAIGTVADDSERRLDVDIPMRFSDQASARASLGLAVGAGLATDGTTLSVDNGAYVSQIDGWTVFRMGSLCVCSTVFTAGKNAYVGEAWGSVYSTSDAFAAPDYPVKFKSEPASVFDYVGGDSDSDYTAAVYRRVSTATAKNAGEVWLIRPDKNVTIGHPVFAVIAMGLV